MTTSQAHIHAEIGRLIARLARIWRRESDQALSDHGLSDATAIPLLVLSRQGDHVRQGVLAPTDRRAKTLHLTKAGKAKVEETNRVLRRVRASLLKDIDAADLSITFETLRRIEQRALRLHEAGESPKAGPEAT